MEVRNLIERAAWTAAQTSLAIIVASGVNWVDPALWKTAAIAGVASGLSALKTSIKSYVAARKL